MAAYLLDTHVWLWLQASPARVDDELLDHLADERNEVMLSAASSWEIAIKHRLGKLSLPDRPSRYVPDRSRRSGIGLVGIDHADALAVAELPDHHRDPFDRLLVAQANRLGATLVTVDRVFEPYEVDIRWA